MMRHKLLEHRFIENIPETMEPGVLYVSMEYGTASHLCCCGCGSEVVTPFTPTDWKLTYDGETVSLWPSIGNWTLPCRSHYVIDRGRVREAPSWSNEQIVAEQQRDKRAKQKHYEQGQNTEAPDSSVAAPLPLNQEQGWLSRIKGWLWRG
ncbi:DUF6527 family protein [Anatilimnocola floriformis]|uniref:DUF6527 family protein n=1 Tax=Anatilimnocola floriformis TaxID=2948575 RepID=UPI0020C4EB07|nr:DUF6527 family protein [Anatilimnocola floriformis]